MAAVAALAKQLGAGSLAPLLALPTKCMLLKHARPMRVPRASH